MKIRLRHVVEDIDRHGNLRRYVRTAAGKIRIRETPGAPEFLAAYQAAFANGAGGTRNAGAPAKGSFRWLYSLWFGSPEFKHLDAATQAWQRHALDSICEKHAHKPVALMQAKHVRALRNERADKPSAGNKRVKAIRAMFAWAVEEDHAPHDPTIGVKAIKYASAGHHTWTPEEIEQFKARHPVGTRTRLALDILRFTTGRREDAVRLGKQHLRNGRLKFRQAKNEHRNPVDMDIPAHPELLASIEATPSANLTFLTTEHGNPFTPAGFGNWFRDQCDQANLRHCSAHGLRKATPTEMAEGGATPHELMAITGHRTLKEVERYTRAANNAKLADSAMAKLKR